MDMDIRQQLEAVIEKLTGNGIMTEDEGNALFDTIMGANLLQGEMNKLLMDLSIEAGLPVVTNTRERVARWRKIIISLMLAGILSATIESVVPGMYYTLFEKMYTTVTTLLSAGITADTIRSVINNPPSAPSIPSIPIPNIPGLITSLTNGLTTGFFMAASMAVGCIDIVCRGSQAIVNQLTRDNFYSAARLAVQLVLPGGISYAFKVLRGDFDEDIANLIDRGVILNIAQNTVRDVKDTITDAVRESAENVGNAMLDITWSDVAPNSGLEPSINSIINNAIRKQIEQIKDNPQNTASITELLNDILNVLRADDKVAAIEVFKNKYREINRTIPMLLELLTAKQAELKADSDNFSQPEPRSASMSDSSQLSRTQSLFKDYKYPVKSDDPNAVRNEPVVFPSVNRFDILRDREILEQSCVLPKKEKEVKKIIWNDKTDPFLYQFINVWLNKNYPDFIKKLNLLSAEDHNAIIRRIKELIPQNGYDLLSSIGNPNLDRSEKELYELFNSIYGTIQVQMNTYAGGRRHKKSRQYKKRRMTQRRRTIRRKGRRTRKGKKRRSTKRRR
jgi:hypothetical protein